MIDPRPFSVQPSRYFWAIASFTTSSVKIGTYRLMMEKNEASMTPPSSSCFIWLIQPNNSYWLDKNTGVSGTFHDFITLAPVLGAASNINLHRQRQPYANTVAHQSGVILPLCAQSAMTTSALRKNYFEFIVASNDRGEGVSISMMGSRSSR